MSATVEDPDYLKHGGFPEYEPADPPPGFVRFLSGMRRLQDLAVSANPSEDVWDGAADLVEELVELLAPSEAPEGVPPAGRTPKLPGMGDVRWGAFLGALADAGYDGHIAIEVEDRAFEGALEKRRESLIISRRFLLQYLHG